MKPTGTLASMTALTLDRSSGSWLAVRLDRTADIPQPISTPTAAGLIACSMAMTEPTVAPLP